MAVNPDWLDLPAHLTNNSHFKEDKLCYTEDNILVYNLYVDCFPEDFSLISEEVIEADLMQYFTQYGEISSLNIKIEKDITHIKLKKQPYKKAFVCLKNASSAADVLKNKYPVPYHLRSISIQPAFSWMQPGILEQDKHAPSATKKLKQICNEENFLSKLSDDCLIHIFSYLPWENQINLASSYDRLWSIFEFLFRMQKSVVISCDRKNLTLMQMRELLLKHGDCIEEAHLYDESSHMTPRYLRYLKMVFSSCMNLHWLELNSIRQVHLDTYAKLCTNLKFLTKVELKSCEIKDEVCKYLSQLPMLYDLDISGNVNITGKYLSEFPKLTNLNISNCTCVEEQHFCNLCKNGRLKVLNIRNCSSLNHESFNEMISNLNDLTDLTISNNSYNTDSLHILTGLRNLTRLFIDSNWNHPLKETFLQFLADNKGDTLQELLLYEVTLNETKKYFIYRMTGLRKLSIHRIFLDDNFLRKLANLANLEDLNIADCRVHSPQGIGSFFERSNNLRSLNISSCRYITPDYLYYIFEKVKKSNRSTPCTLYIHKLLRFKSKSILMDEKYLECASILRLSYQKNRIMFEKNKNKRK